MEEFRMRRALGKDSFGSNRARTLDLVCPYCNSTDLEIAKKRTSKGYHVECNYCSIEWVTYRIPEKVRKAAQKQNDMGDRMDNSRATDGPRQA
jgi:Zn ribbon nucleic-acid-binding protein